MVLPVRVRSKLAGVLRHHHRDGVLLARCHQPIRQAFGEIGVVERFPGFIDDDDRWAAIFDLTLNAAEQIAEDGHAFLLGLGIQNAGKIKPNHIAFERKRVFQDWPNIQP